MTWSERAGGIGLALALAVSGGVADAQAQAPKRFEIRVIVSEIGDRPGGIDPRGRELHAKLSKQFRYESLKVLDMRTFRLEIDELGTLRLPNGKPLRIRPLQLTDRGLLLAAQVGDIQTDLKLPHGRLLVIDGDTYGDGRLVVSFETHW